MYENKGKEMTMKYTIPEFKISKILRKLDALNEKVSKCNSIKLEYTVSDVYDHTYVMDDGKGYILPVVDIDLTNPFVFMNGWSFLAVIEHFKDGNVILQKIYDVDIPDHFRTSGSHCDHCETNRFRKNTYLIYNKEQDKIYQVGSTCINTYLGFDASLLVQHAAFITSLNEGMSDKDIERIKYRGLLTADLLQFLKICYGIINTIGYVSGKMLRDNPFKYTTTTGCIAFNQNYSEWINNSGMALIKSDKAKSVVESAIEWANNLDTTKSTYAHNVQVIIKSGYVTYKTANIMASLIPSYMKFVSTQDDTDLKKVSNFVGQKGQRIDVIMVLKNIVTFNSPYGISKMHSFTTEEGNIIIWFTNTVDLKEGVMYKGKVTVSKHNEFKGIKQTIVNRCKLEEA